jgi:hypothetical protein
MTLKRFSILELDFALIALDALERRDWAVETAIGEGLEPYRSERAGPSDDDGLVTDQNGLLDLNHTGLVIGQWTIDEFRFGLRLGGELLLYVQRFATREEPVSKELPGRFVDLVMGMAMQGSGRGRVAVEGSVVAKANRVALILGSPPCRRATVRAMRDEGASVLATSVFFADLRRAGIDPMPDVVETAQWIGQRAAVPVRHIPLEQCCVVAVSSAPNAPVGGELPHTWLRALLDRHALTDNEGVEQLAGLMAERPSTIAAGADAGSSHAVMGLLTAEWPRVLRTA